MKIWWSLFNPLLATAATCPWPPSAATLPQVRTPHVNSHSRGCVFIALNAVLRYCASQLSWGTLRKSGGTLARQMLLWNDTIGISSWVCMRKNTYPFVVKNFFHWRNTPNAVWSKHTHSLCLLLSHLHIHIFIPITDGGTRTWSPIFSTKIKFWFHYFHPTYLKKACLSLPYYFIHF